MSIESAIEKQKKEIKILEENISVFVDQIKYKKDVKYLMDEYGYSERSANEVIKYASNNLWRDS